MQLKIVEKSNDTFYLADCARAIGVEPKNARKRLRGLFGTLEKHDKKRWAFKNSDWQAVARIIRD